MQSGIPAIKYQRGYIREDGKVFYKYQKGCKNGERWITKEKYQKYKEQENEYGKQYYYENLDACKRRNKAWRNKNLEAQRKRAKKWRDENIEKCRKNSIKWNTANYIKIKMWRDVNKHIINASSAKRRKYIKNNAGFLNKDQECIIKTIYEGSARISRCLNIPHEVDHIIPISKGGLHIPQNLQILPAKINRRKHNKLA